MKHFITTIILSLSLLLLGCEDKNQTNSVKQYSKQKTEIQKNSKVDLLKITEKSKEALSFCKEKKYNTDFCILIDMSLHSGVNRFFVWDFKNNKTEKSFLVSHGCCEGAWDTDSSKDNPVFSNINNSHCSSLGKYKIGKRGYSNWGIHVNYLMHGLDSTNNNALSRVIVLHSWEAISDTEVFPKGTPEGWGCPAISNKNMKIIDEKLQLSKKPVLMWIYY